MRDDKVLVAIGRGLGVGLGFGVCLAAVEASMSGLGAFYLNLPPMVWAEGKAAVLTVLLAGLLGLLLGPLRRLLIALHWLALVGIWVGATLWVAVNPGLPLLELVPAVVAGVVVGLALLLPAWLRVAGAIVACLALITGVYAPSVRAWIVPNPAPSIAAGAAAAGAPDVVLVVLGAARAQNFSAYGYGRRTTPRFDELAESGALFMNASAASSQPLAATASLLLGQFPSTHLAFDAPARISDDASTLAERFMSAGYDTRCFSANPYLSDGVGLNRGFAAQDRAYLSGDSNRRGHLILRLLDRVGLSPEDKGGADAISHLERWLHERPDSGKPAFVLIDLREVQSPYAQIPERFQTRFGSLSDAERRRVSALAEQASMRELSAYEQDLLGEPLVDLYDQELAYTDALLGRAVDALSAGSRWQNTALLVVGDHGVSLGEHGYGLGDGLPEETLRVPLLLRGPGVEAGARIKRPVSTVSVFATALVMAELAAPAGPSVDALLPLRPGAGAPQPILAERLLGYPIVHGQLKDVEVLRSYREGEWKLVVHPDGHASLYNLSTDTAEAEDKAAENPEELARLQAGLADWARRLSLSLPLATKSPDPL